MDRGLTVAADPRPAAPRAEQARRKSLHAGIKLIIATKTGKGKVASKFIRKPITDRQPPDWSAHDFGLANQTKIVVERIPVFSFEAEETEEHRSDL